MTTPQRLYDALASLKVHDHLCLIYETREEQFSAVVPFVKIGLGNGEKCFYIADENTAEGVLSAMHEYGIDIKKSIKSGQLHVVTKQEAYLKDGRFEPNVMVAFLSAEVRKAKEEGYSALRVTGEMTWALGNDPGNERLIEYESLLNAFFRNSDCLAICQYNRRKFSPEIIIDIIRTHPEVIYRDIITRNYFFEPPEEILKKTDYEAKLNRMLSAVQEWEVFDKSSMDDQLKHRAAFEVNPGALSISSFDEGIFIEINDNFSRLSGYDRGEIIRKSAFDIGFWVNPGDGIRLRKILKEEKVVQNYEFESRKKNGETSWIILSAVLINYHGLECILADSFEITDRVKAEKTINNQAAFFETLINSIPTPVFYKDVNGTYKGCNKHFEEYLGLRKEDIIGKSVYDISPPDLAYKYYKKDKELLDNPGEQKYESRVMGALGEERNVIFRKATFNDSEGKVAGLIGVITDITEIRRYESKLREKTEELDRFFTSALDMLCIADLNGFFIRLNPMFSDILGYPLNELEGKKFLDLVHPDDVQATIGAVNEQKDGKSVLNFINRYRCKDGSYRWLEWRSFPYEDKLIYAAARDITKRVQMEEALLVSEEKYRIISENTGDVIWTLDPITGKFTYVSPSVTRLRGYTPEEVMAQPLDKALSPESFMKLANQLPQAIAAVESGDESASTRIDTVDQPHKNGSIVHTEVVSSFMTGKDGKVKMIIGVSRDITERIVSEQKIQQIQKLESLGVMAGGIAHDFNNLLTVILGNIDLSMKLVPVDSKVTNNLRSAEKACLSAADLTRQMLAYAGKGQLLVQEVSMNDVIGEMDMVMSISISKKIRTKYSLYENLPCIMADSGQMKQIVMNLVINASEAIGEREGTITVKTGLISYEETLGESDNMLMAENLGPGNLIYLEVSDTGCGIDKEILSNIFDPFFTTKFVGRGLGLAAVMGIVRTMGGAIKVVSEADKGTIFTIYLPAPAAEGELFADVSQLKTALIIDDEDEVLDIGSQMLEALGYNALVARNGAEALEVLKVSAEKGSSVSFILLDVGMPVMDGNETYEEIMKIYRDMPVFITSGYGKNDIEERFRDKRIAGVLNKPYMIDAIKTMLDEYYSKPESI